jgi:hypothetical protein
MRMGDLAFAVCVLAAVILIACLSTCAHAADCATKSGITGSHHAVWSGRVPGHRGSHCWFASREERHVSLAHGSGMVGSNSKTVAIRVAPDRHSRSAMERHPRGAVEPQENTKADTLTAFDRAIPTASSVYMTAVTIAVWDWRPPDWTPKFNDLVESANARH